MFGIQGVQAQDELPRLYFCMYETPAPGLAKNMYPVYPGVALSSDTGATWRSIGWTNNRCSDAAHLASDASTIFIANDNGVLVSRNNGDTWKLATTWRVRDALCVQTTRDTVVTGTATGVYVSTDKGLSWQSRSRGLPPLDATYISDILVSDGAFFVATAGGVFRSDNRGETWKRSGLDGRQIEHLARHPRLPDLLYACGPAGLWRSSDAGRTWTDISQSLGGARIQCVVADPSDASGILVGTAAQGILKSRDMGLTWNNTSAGLQNLNVTTLAYNAQTPTVVYAGTDNGAFISRDGGAVWRPFTLRLGYVKQIRVQP